MGPSADDGRDAGIDGVLRCGGLPPAGVAYRETSLPRPAKPCSSHTRSRPATPRQAAP